MDITTNPEIIQAARWYIEKGFSVFPVGKYGQVGYLATMRADTAVYQPKAFCKITGIKP